jgi:hypothetical protein
MGGLDIAFTQEFFDGAAPPPGTLFDYPFLFGGTSMALRKVFPVCSIFGIEWALT